MDPRVAALSYSYDCSVSLRRTLATSGLPENLSFAGEKTIGEFLVQSFVNVILI